MHELNLEQRDIGAIMGAAMGTVSDVLNISLLPWHPRYLLRTYTDALLPSQPDARYTAVRTALGTTFALGPGEHLYLPDESASGQLAALAKPDIFVIDVSSAQLVMRVAGSRACELLASGCGVDLRPARFAVGHFAQTRLGPFAVLIHRASESAYDVHGERSLLESMRTWLDLSASALTGNTLSP